MHYANLIVVERPPNITEESIKSAVGELMEDHRDWWDFWQIGGRWTGLFDGYEPAKDQKNIKPCKLCGATGKRRDMRVENGCNGCEGTGKAVEWPTQWVFHPGDVVPIEALTPEHYAQIHRVVLDGYGAFSSEEFVPWAAGSITEQFRKKELPPLEWIQRELAGYIAVIVDNHN